MQTLSYNPYVILGCTNKSTEDEIKSAYRQKAKESHPDLHNGSKCSEDLFKKVNEAYQILSNPNKKSELDRQLAIRNKPQRQEVSYVRYETSVWRQGDVGVKGRRGQQGAKGVKYCNQQYRNEHAPNAPSAPSAPNCAGC